MFFYLARLAASAVPILNAVSLSVTSLPVRIRISCSYSAFQFKDQLLSQSVVLSAFGIICEELAAFMLEDL